MRIEGRLPEVTLLFDARGKRPENAASVGDFWYEPEIWALPLPPAPKILYAGLCSFLGHGQINHKDLRNILEGVPDREIARTVDDLVFHNLLTPAPESTSVGILMGYAVRSVKEFENQVRWKKR